MTLLLRIYGRVQGVGFRQALRHQAHALGLRGWVRNRRDGSVESSVDGAPDALDAFYAWCQTGPVLAQVDRVDVLDASALDLPLNGCTILPTE